MRFTVALAALLLLLFACHDPVPVSIDSPEMTQVPTEEPPPPPPPDDPASSTTAVCPKTQPSADYFDRAAECVEVSGPGAISAGSNNTYTCRGWGRTNPQLNDWFEVRAERARSWSSSSQSILTVGETSFPQAIVTGVAPGKASVNCRIDGVLGSIAVTVTGTRTLSSLFILPDKLTLQAGQASNVAVHYVDNFGQVDKIHPPVEQWTSDNEPVATVAPTGEFGGQIARVTALGSASNFENGIARIRARVGNITSSPATITVTPPPTVTSVTVTPTSATIAEFTFATLTATAFDQFGRAMSGRSAIWSTDNTNVLSLNSAGAMSVYATGVHWGSASVYVQVDGVAGNSVPITVTTDGTIGGYYVSSLSPWGDPFTAPGTYYLTPTTSTPGTPPITYKWEITYSDNSRPPITTGYQPGPFPLSAHDGAYKIYVTVTPRQLYGAGSPTRWTYNVCTGGGGGGGGDPPLTPPVAVAPNSPGDYKGAVKPKSGGARPYRVVYGCSGPA